MRKCTDSDECANSTSEYRMGLQIAGNAIKITCAEEVLENVFQLQSLLLRLSFVAVCW